MRRFDQDGPKLQRLIFHGWKHVLQEIAVNRLAVVIHHFFEKR